MLSNFSLIKGFKFCIFEDWIHNESVYFLGRVRVWLSSEEGKVKVAVSLDLILCF